MIEDPRNIYRATRLLSIAKYLERIGDHATNIAEEAIFMVEGHDVRHSGLGKPPETDLAGQTASMKGVLFVCAGNAASSQIAEGWARRLAPRGIEVASAGLNPTGVHPLAVQVMAEVGLDLAAASSKAMSDLPLDRFDTVVTLSTSCSPRTTPTSSNDEGVRSASLTPSTRIPLRS
jgi:protein-tyrosine-phosphatase